MTTCLVAGEISRLIDLLVGVTGPDAVLRGEGAALWGQSEELLLVDEEQGRMAQAFNRLSRPLRASWCCTISPEWSRRN